MKFIITKEVETEIEIDLPAYFVEVCGESEYSYTYYACTETGYFWFQFDERKEDVAFGKERYTKYFRFHRYSKITEKRYNEALREALDLVNNLTTDLTTDDTNTVL